MLRVGEVEYFVSEETQFLIECRNPISLTITMTYSLFYVFTMSDENATLFEPSEPETTAEKWCDFLM